MLWVYLQSFLLLLVRVVIPPPKATPINQVTIDAPCPACGHTAGRLLCVRRDEQILVERTCLVCGARSYQDPILNKVDSQLLIHPAEDYFVTAQQTATLLQSQSSPALTPALTAGKN